MGRTGRNRGRSIPRLFCFGLGYTAQRLAASVAAEDWSVAGTARGDGRRGPVAVARFDREHPLAAPDAALHGVTHILLSIPPDDEGDPALASHGGDIVRLAGPTLRWVGYLSTTGVYGDRGGAWVDERREPGPGARKCVG